VLGLILPTDDAGKKADDVKWRIILALPLAFIVVQLILWLLIFKLESLKYAFSIKDFESARAHLNKIYDFGSNTQQAGEVFDQYHEAHDNAMERQEQSPPYVAVLCDSKYCVATWFAMALAFFNQFSGVNCITIYSSDLFENLKMNPITGSALVGIFQLVGCLIATQLNKVLGMRAIFIGGEFIMSVSHLIVAIAVGQEANTLVLVFIMVFLTVY